MRKYVNINTDLLLGGYPKGLGFVPPVWVYVVGVGAQLEGVSLILVVHAV